MTLWTVVSLPGSSVPEILQQNYWSQLPCPSPGALSNPGIKSRSPTLQADSLPSEPAGKPKNTGVGCHSLLQGIFPTQGLNPGLLHSRRILYLLSQQGSPWINWSDLKLCFSLFGLILTQILLVFMTVNWVKTLDYFGLALYPLRV